jgi:predicted ATPase
MHLRSLVLRAEDYPTREHYPFNQAQFHETTRIEFKNPVTFFVGENGSGKSTLLEALCRRCGYHIWQNVPSARFVRNRFETWLHRFLDVEWVDEHVPGSFFGADVFKNFAEVLDMWADADPGQLKYFGGESLLTMSHGQSLMAFFRACYKVPGLYLLDEPETALSPKSQLEVLHLIQEMAAAGHAQFIIATHSPILLACPGADILNFDTTPVGPIEYEDTALYQIYKGFLNDPQAYLAPRD